MSEQSQPVLSQEQLLERAEQIRKLRELSSPFSGTKKIKSKERVPTKIIALEGEEWKDIISWEGYYQISSLGRVKSLSRMVPGPHGSTYMKSEMLLTGALTEDQNRFHLSSVEEARDENIPHATLMEQAGFNTISIDL